MNCLGEHRFAGFRDHGFFKAGFRDSWLIPHDFSKIWDGRASLGKRRPRSNKNRGRDFEIGVKKMKDLGIKTHSVPQILCHVIQL